MSHRKAIVKRLPSVETLGCVSVVCSDKTGTLTANQMTVVRLYTVDDGIADLMRSVPHSPSEAQSRLILTGNLCNNSYRDERGNNVGQATDVAMVNVLREFGLEDRRPYFRRSAEDPFDSEKKMMSITGSMTGVSNTAGNAASGLRPSSDETVYFKGAYEVVLERSRYYLRAEGGRAALDESVRDKIKAAAETMSHEGLRVLAAATGPPSAGEARSLTFCGLQGLQDPPRPGVSDAIASLQRGSVQVVMITGDAESTAIAIARQLGILPGGPGAPVPPTSVLTGKHLDALSQRQLTDRINSVHVFARTNPRHKMRIVEALQSQGHVVAMTGDGVNDAPALKMADIGISMGKGGTDVAKEAADVILVDDNFATILPAVEEGRCSVVGRMICGREFRIPSAWLILTPDVSACAGKGIFYNIQNFLCFQLSTAVSALTLITLCTALGLKLPLNPMQILFINILMDGPPSQSLGVDPVDPAIMKRPPRRRTDAIITRRLVMRILFSATTMVLGTIWVYYGELTGDGFADARDQTMTFTCFVLLDLTSALQSRGLRVPLLPQHGGNRMLATTVSVSAAVQLLLVYFPPLQGIFQTTSLGFADMLLLLCVAALAYAAHEARREWERRQSAREAWEDAVV